MKEEKKVMYERMRQYDKDLENKNILERKCQELEAQIFQMKSEFE